MNATLNPETCSDAELALAAQLDQGVWLDELYRRFEKRIFGCAHQMVAPSEVEDAVQEIGLRIVRGLPGFRGDSSVTTWMYAVARHTCLDVRRRRDNPSSPVAEFDDLTSPQMVLPEEGFEQSIIACRTATALQDLPSSQQDVVLLRLGEGLSTKDTALRLGISQDAVKSKLRRARSNLRGALEEYVSCPECGPGVYALGAGEIK
jgi:RNA polymerase sigma-70 factor (ECF subfamily)